MSIKDETRYQYNLTLRRDTRRNWRLKNPVLLSGEMGIEYEDITVSDGEETAEFPTASNNQKMVSFKVGNGVDEWNNLPYASGEQGVAGEQGDPLRVDELDTIDRRYSFDDKNKGFSFLAIDEGKIYFKLTNGIGDWTEGFPFGQGIKGEKGEKGTSIESVEFTSTTHESGLPHQLDAIDTYTIIFDNGITEDFKIQNGTSTVWSADGTPYPINAQVYHNGKQWLALRANSVEPTEGDDWTELVGKKYIDDNLSPAWVADDPRAKIALNAAGAAPIYACRAWVNFDGTGTVAIRASGNVSSITDNGVGDYTVNFTTAMPDDNYSVGGLANSSTDGHPICLTTILASSLGILTARDDKSYYTRVDYSVVNINVFR